jgi:hypothetical protein
MSVNLNSETWIEEQYAARNLKRTPENRRMLQREYYETRPYSSVDQQARSKTKPASTVSAPKPGTQTQATTSEGQTKQELAEINRQVLGASVGPFEGTSYVYPSRRVNYSDVNASQIAASGEGGLNSTRTPAGIVSYYNGPLLIDENNDVSRRQYDASGGDVLPEYASILNPVERSSFLTTLKDYGFYLDDKPSELAFSGRGLTNTDERAIQSFLNYSSSQGRTWRAMLPIVQGQQKIVSSGGRRVSVVSTEDATRVFREESLRILGRMPTQQEIRAAVSTIQSQQRSRGGGGTMDAPAVTTAAQEAAKQAAPGERAAQSAGQAVGQIFALLGGR